MPRSLFILNAKYENYNYQDLDQQWSSPLLFPDKSPESLLEKMPPTVIFSAEFDMFITETERLARRMRRAGKLLEFCCMPGEVLSHDKLAYHDVVLKVLVMDHISTHTCSVMTDSTHTIVLQLRNISEKIDMCQVEGNIAMGEKFQVG